MKKVIFSLIVAFVISLVVPKTASTQVVVKVNPNRSKVIVVKPKNQKRNHIWVVGHWKWSKKYHKYVWIKGCWEHKKRGRVWVAGHWRVTPAGHIWVAGRWKRRV